MKRYKNVGVYKLCRMFPEDTTKKIQWRFTTFGLPQKTDLIK